MGENHPSKQQAKQWFVINRKSTYFDRANYNSHLKLVKLVQDFSLSDFDSTRPDQLCFFLKKNFFFRNVIVVVVF